MDNTCLDFGWVRRWLPFNGLQPTGDGYSEVVEANARSSSTLAELSDVPCLVLLGAPGTGKTRDARQAVARLATNRASVELVLVSRSHDLSTVLLGLAQSERGIAWKSGQTVWHVFIDGVDESHGGAPGFEELLKVLLESLRQSGGPMRNLRLRLLCRTAEWTASLDRTLESFWIEDDVQKLQITPLTEEDVRTALAIATHDEHQSAEFVNQVAELRIEALASRPVSLKLLIDLFKEFGNLPKRQAELYQRGLQALLASNDRKDPLWSRRGPLDIVERMTVAARIAAVTAFSGASKVSTSLSAKGLGSGTSPLTAMVGGYEPSPPTSFPVSEVDVLDILRSPLFEAIGPDRYAWSHQTFMEYLAARYLAEHSLTPEQIHEFLSVQEPGGKGGIAPQLREIAAWAATIVPAYFRLLSDREPDVLLQSDIAAASSDDREHLVSALLTRFDAGELVVRYSALAPAFGRLLHPGLSDQLRRFIESAENSVFARRAAIEIAERCNIDELAPSLVLMALSDREPIGVRAAAARAVSRLDHEKSKAALVQVLRSDLTADSQDELKGYSLLATWPKHLPVGELIQLLTRRKDPQLIGSYAMFLYKLEITSLSPDQSVTALKWVEERRSSIGDTASDQYAEAGAAARVFWAAVGQISASGVREVLADMIVSAFKEFSTWPFQTAGQDGMGTWPDASDDRMAVVRSALERTADAPNLARALVRFVPDLIRPTDVLSYLAALRAEARPNERHALANIVAEASSKGPMDNLDDVLQATESMPELAEALGGLFYVELDSSTAQWMRDAWRRSQASVAKEHASQLEASKVDDAVLAGLTRIEEGDAEHWWHLNLHLFVSASGRFESEFEFRSDLSVTPGWSRLTSRDRSRTINAAYTYLLRARLKERRWIGTHTHHRPAAAGFRALRLLHDQRSEALDELPAEAWSSWAPAAICFFDNAFSTARDSQIAIVRRAWKAAPFAVLNTIARMAIGPHSAGVPDRVLEILEGAFDERIGDLLDRLTCPG